MLRNLGTYDKACNIRDTTKHPAYRHNIPIHALKNKKNRIRPKSDRNKTRQNSGFYEADKI